MASPNPAQRFDRRDAPLIETIKTAVTDLHDRLRVAEDGVSGLKQNASSVVDSLVAQITANFSELFTRAHALTTAIELGEFVSATSATPANFTEGLTLTLILDGGANLPFIPSSIVNLVRASTADDFAFARVLSWNASTRAIELEIFAASGDDGPHNDVRVEIGALATLAMLTMVDEVAGMQVAVGLDKNAVELDRQDAAASAAAATSARTDAIAARDTARLWATEVEDTPVEAALYSSRHYAAKAAASAAAANLWNPASYMTRAQALNHKTGARMAMASLMSLIATFSLVFTSPDTVQAGWYTHAAPAGTYTDERGVLRDAAADVPRIDYAVSGECWGALFEQARTNSIRNNSNVGAVAGDLVGGGALPTNWSIIGGAGVTKTIGLVTINGIQYLSLKVNGTATGTGLTIYFDNQAAAASGQSWATSAYLALVAGSLANAPAYIGASELTAGGGQVTFGQQGVVPAAAPGRVSHVRTLAGGATVAKIAPYVYFSYANGATVDFTVLIGLPQAEQGGAASSPIKTTNAAVTRPADVMLLTGTDFSSWFRADEGLLVLEFTFKELLATAQYIASFNAGALQEDAILIFRNNANGAITATIRAANATVASFNLGVAVAGVKYKLALSYAANAFHASLNGGAVISDTVGAVPAGIDRVGFGGYAAGGLSLHGWLFSVDYAPKAAASPATDLPRLSALT